MVLPGVAPSAPGLPHALIQGVVDLPLCLLLGALRGSEQPEEVKWNFLRTGLNPSPCRAFTPGNFCFLVVLQAQNLRIHHRRTSAGGGASRGRWEDK